MIDVIDAIESLYYILYYDIFILIQNGDYVGLSCPKYIPSTKAPNDNRNKYADHNTSVSISVNIYILILYLTCGYIQFTVYFVKGKVKQ